MNNYDKLFDADDRNPEAEDVTVGELDDVYHNRHKMDDYTMDFFGLTGDPVHDSKRKSEIARELGPDNFDYDQYEQMEKDNDYWDHIDQEVANINAR